MKSQWDYTLWENFNDLVSWDEKSASAYLQTAKFTKELSTELKGFGIRLKKMRDKYTVKKEGNIKVYSDSYTSVIELVGTLGEEHDKLGGELSEIENAIKTAIVGQKEWHKRIVKRYESGMTDMNKEEVAAKAGVDRYVHAFNLGRRAFAVMKDTEADKSNTVLDMERSRNMFSERSQACDRAKGESRTLISKYNELCLSTITDTIDTVIKDLAMQMRNRLTSQVTFLTSLSTCLKQSFSNSLTSLAHVFPVFAHADPLLTISAIQLNYTKKDFALPPPMPFEDLGSIESARMKPKKKAFFKSKNSSTSDMSSSLRNDIKSIVGMRSMVELYKNNPQMGQVVAVETKLAKLIKSFSCGMKQIRKVDSSLYDELVILSSSFYSTDGDSSGAGEWSEEFTKYQVKYGVIIEDFSMDEAGTLSVKKDERIEILYEDTSGWVYVSRCDVDQTQGHVPESYIRVIDQ